MWVTIFFYLRLVAYGLLVAGCFFVLCGATIKYLRMWKSMAGKFGIPDLRSQESKDISTSSRFPIRIRALMVFVALCAGSVGYIARDLQQYNRTDSYRMFVLSRVAPYRYMVKTERGKAFMFEVCRNMDDPGFEVGETDDVVFEESSDIDGECKSFAGPHNGWQTVRDREGNIIKAEVRQ